MTVFYVVESMQRDREVRIEPVLWTKPTPNSVLLLSKFLATFLLMLSVITIAGLTAIAIQLLRGHAPVELYPYLVTYSVILIPSIVFTAGVSILLNVVLREKYLTYVVIVGVGAGLSYLYSQGYNHWLYNPALYQLWTYSDLTGAGGGRILTQRIYWLALSCLCLALAHLGFRRKSAKGFRVNGRLGSTGWALGGNGSFAGGSGRHRLDDQIAIRKPPISKMRNPFHTPFVAVFQNEVLLNAKRLAPYVLMALFSATQFCGGSRDRLPIWDGPRTATSISPGASRRSRFFSDCQFSMPSLWATR
jgi:hypothetical protein